MDVGNLTPYQQYNKILQMAGWYEGRQVDVRVFEEQAEADNIPFTSAMKHFLQEFGEINSGVEVVYNNNGHLSAFKFTFNTSAKAAFFSKFEELYQDICTFAKEKVLSIGEIGADYDFHVCAIGESGRLYSSNYEDSIQVYDSMIECIACALERCNLVYVRVYDKNGYLLE